MPRLISHGYTRIFTVVLVTSFLLWLQPGANGSCDVIQMNSCYVKYENSKATIQMQHDDSAAHNLICSEIERWSSCVESASNTCTYGTRGRSVARNLSEAASTAYQQCVPPPVYIGAAIKTTTASPWLLCLLLAATSALAVALRAL